MEYEVGKRYQFEMILDGQEITMNGVYSKEITFDCEAARYMFNTAYFGFLPENVYNVREYEEQ